MFALDDDLSDFARAIVLGDEPSSRIDAGYAHYPAAVGLEIYRNNYRGNLQDALAGAYPVIEKLVGQAFFRRIARAYIGKHGSQDGNLHLYGARMAEFLEAFEPAQALVYLPDVARLEWACHLAYFAEDAASLNPCELAKIPACRHADLILLLHPACHLLHSRYPVAAIWQANWTADACEVDLDRGPCNALVSRRDDIVAVTELTDADAAWLRGVRDGLPLGAATDETAARYPDLDLPALLPNLLALNALANFKLKDAS